MLDRGRVTPVVKEKLYIFGYIFKVQGDNLWVDRYFAGTWQEITEKNVPVFYARNVNAGFVPAFTNFTQDDLFTVFFDIYGGILDIIGHELRANIESSFLQLDDIISVLTEAFVLKKRSLEVLHPKPSEKA